MGGGMCEWRQSELGECPHGLTSRLFCSTCIGRDYQAKVEAEQAEFKLRQREAAVSSREAALERASRQVAAENAELMRMLSLATDQIERLEGEMSIRGKLKSMIWHW
jgi:hypothetical protein